MLMVTSSAGLSKMVNTPDLILHGEHQMDNLIPLKGIILRRRGVSNFTNVLFFS